MMSFFSHIFSSPEYRSRRPRQSRRHGSSHGSESAHRQSEYYAKHYSERDKERYRPNLAETRLEPDTTPRPETRDRANPSPPGHEGVPAVSSDNDTRMEDADGAHVTFPHYREEGHARPPPVESGEARASGSCEHLEDFNWYENHGQLPQQRLEHLNEECDRMRKEINRLRGLQSRELAAKESLTRQLEDAEANLSRQTEAAQAKTRQLQKAQRALTVSKSQLERVEAESNDFRRKWKQSVKELGQLARTSRSAMQVTDSDLDMWASQLRTAIRDFAIRHFESDAPFSDFPERFERAQGAVGFELMRETTASTDDLRTFLSSQAGRSAVIQSFMWRFLCRAVFSAFLWVGELAPTVSHMHLNIRNAARDNKTFKKFKSWTASTTNLLIDLEGIGSERETREENVKVSRQRLAEEILGVIAPFANVDPATDVYVEFLRELDSVLERAITMDRDICRQAADICWIFSRDVPCQFDAAAMADERDEMSPSGDSAVDMVVAPALCKRGRSNGDHLEEHLRVILPMVSTHS